MSNIIETKYKSVPLWEQTEEITIEPLQSQTITLPLSIESAAKSFYFTQNILKNKASEYQYNVKSSINCKIVYKNEKLKNENFMILFNRDIEETDGYFENTSILDLQGNDIESIELFIKNNSDTDDLTISKMAIYESDDIKVTSIAKVLKEETIAADLIQVTSVFTDALFTQILQTNAMSRSARIAKPGDVVDYFMAEGINLGCYSTTLGNEQEQFKITTTTAGIQTDHYYWYAIIDGEDAYKYLTTIDPREKYKDISDSDRDAFRYMVLKPTTTSKKFAITFALDENGHMTPTLDFGVGSDPTGTTNRGKGQIYKNSNGFYQIYWPSDGGDKVGIAMDDSGLHMYGLADQHTEYVHFRDNAYEAKLVGEDKHVFKYVVDENDAFIGILEDDTYFTSYAYIPGNA